MIVTSVCNHAKLDMADGVHQPGDTYRLALYTEQADLDETTTKYRPKNEASGTGYPKGGFVLSGRRSLLDDGVACVTFNDVSEERCTFEAFGALIYNETRHNAALATLVFDTVKRPSNGKFELEFPLLTANSAVIAIA
jgi:hypothetical protein